MLDQLITVTTAVGAVGTGLTAGVMLAFSLSVLRALAGLPAPQGIAAMRRINVVIVNPLFLLLFLGTTVCCVVLVVTTLLGDGTGAAWRVGGAALFLVGMFGVTVAANIPLNNALDRVDPDSADGAEVWSGFLTRWTRWNHVRALAATAATAALVVAG